MREMLTASHAAEMLGVDKRTMLRLARDGKLRSYRTPGGQHRFRREDVEMLAAGQSSKSRTSVSTIQNKRDEIENLNLEVQARRAKRDLARIEAEDTEAEREQAEAHRHADQEAARAEQARMERQRQDRAERRQEAERQARDKKRRAWESEWIGHGSEALPADAPSDVRLNAQRAIRKELAEFTPEDSQAIITTAVGLAVRQALAPWRRGKEIEKAIEDALQELPFQVRHLRLGTFYDPPLTEWEARAQQEARSAIAGLSPDSSLAEIRATSTQAVERVALQYHQQQAEKEYRDSIQSVLGWVSGEEERDAARQALEKLPLDCGRAQMERTRDTVLALIREKGKAAEDAKRKETQAGSDADRYLWRVGEYIEELARDGECGLNFWDRCQLAEKIKQAIRPKLVQALFRGELAAGEARDLVEEAVQREL